MLEPLPWLGWNQNISDTACEHQQIESFSAFIVLFPLYERNVGFLLLQHAFVKLELDNFVQIRHYFKGGMR